MERESHVPEGLIRLVWGYQETTWGTWGRRLSRTEGPFLSWSIGSLQAVLCQAETWVLIQVFMWCHEAETSG